jgi:hypothetical protein
LYLAVLGSPVPTKPTKKKNQNCIFGGKNWTCKMWLQVSKSLKCLILMKITFKGPQPSPKFPPVTLYPTHNCVIHSKDTISQPPFSTSPTKYRKCTFLDSSTVA